MRQLISTILCVVAVLLGSTASAQTFTSGTMSGVKAVEYPAGFYVFGPAGATTTGGMGKPLCLVTNTNASGEGSYAWAVTTCAEADDGAYVRFAPDVCGTITLSANLTITQGNLTIDGSDACGQGVIITSNALFDIRTNNVVITQMRFANFGNDSTPRDCLTINSASNVVIDRTLMFGCTDENFDITSFSFDAGIGGSPVRNVTLQYSLIAAVAIGTNTGAAGNTLIARDVDGIAIWRSVSMHTSDRCWKFNPGAPLDHAADQAATPGEDRESGPGRGTHSRIMLVESLCYDSIHHSRSAARYVGNTAGLDYIRSLWMRGPDNGIAVEKNPPVMFSTDVVPADGANYGAAQFYGLGNVLVDITGRTWASIMPWTFDTQADLFHIENVFPKERLSTDPCEDTDGVLTTQCAFRASAPDLFADYEFGPGLSGSTLLDYLIANVGPSLPVRDEVTTTFASHIAGESRQGAFLYEQAALPDFTGSLGACIIGTCIIGEGLIQ